MDNGVERSLARYCTHYEHIMSTRPVVIYRITPMDFSAIQHLTQVRTTRFDPRDSEADQMPVLNPGHALMQGLSAPLQRAFDQFSAAWPIAKRGN